MTTNIVFGQDKAVAAWVAGQLGYTNFEGYYCGAVGIAENGQLIGGTCFHNWYEKDGVVEMTSASITSKWLTRRMIRAIFNYAFELLECQLVVMRVSENNTVMVNIARRFGCSGYLIPRLRGRNEAEWIFTLTDDQWRSSPFRRTING